MDEMLFQRVLRALTLCCECGTSGEERICGKCLIQAILDAYYLQALANLMKMK